MRIPRIYSTQASQQALIDNREVELEAKPSHHLIKVLRMQAGRELVVFNGEGGQFSASITETGKKNARIKLHDFHADSAESPLTTELGIALSRGERFDFVLQKASELGVSQITPLITERTEVKLNAERLQKRMDSWNGIIVSACEQCGRNILPKLNPPQSLKDYLTRCEASSKYVLHHRNSTRLDHSEAPNAVALLIGPEGGLSEAEIALAHQHEFANLALGPRVLRTETAPIAALTIVQYMWGDM